MQAESQLQLKLPKGLLALSLLISLLLHWYIFTTIKISPHVAEQEITPLSPQLSVHIINQQILTGQPQAQTSDAHHSKTVKSAKAIQTTPRKQDRISIQSRLDPEAQNDAAPKEKANRQTKTAVGLAFRPKLKKLMKETELFRQEWQDYSEPLVQQGQHLLWDKNECFEITDNEEGNGQIFHFSSRCPSNKKSKINLNKLVESIRPTYGPHSKIKIE